MEYSEETMLWLEDHKMTDIDEGIYYDMPFSVYLELDAMSTSRIKYLVEDIGGSPQLYWANVIQGLREDKPCFNLGRAAHALLLEPDVFYKTYCEGLDTSAEFKTINNKKYKMHKEEQESLGFEVLSPTMWAQIHAQVDIMQMYSISYKKKTWKIQDFISLGDSEVSMFAMIGGILRKCRFDYLKPGLGIDFKTVGQAGNSHPRKFRTQAYKFGYHIQQCWYQEIAEHLMGKAPDMAFLCSETAPPFMTRLNFLSEGFLGNARMLIDEALDIFNHCRKTGNWFPASEAETIDIPGWADNRSEV